MASPESVDRDDERVPRVLLLAKEIHQRGEDLSRTGSDLDAMISIHHVHLAVEMTLREIASHLGMPQEKVDPGFDRLVLTIESRMKEDAESSRLPNVLALRKLNKARNAVQHGAELMHPEMAREYSVITRDFLREVFASVFKIAYDEVSERDLVADKDLRTLLHHAHSAARSGSSESFVVALAALRFCLESALQSWPKHLPPPSGVFPGKMGHDQVLMDRIHVLEEETTLLATRVDVLEYRWLLGVAPDLLTSADGSITIDTSEAILADADAVRRAERFVIGCIMSWQRMSRHPRYVDNVASIVQFGELAASLGSDTAPSPR